VRCATKQIHHCLIAHRTPYLLKIGVHLYKVVSKGKGCDVQQFIDSGICCSSHSSTSAAALISSKVSRLSEGEEYHSK
jgi:hypothetical protein